MSARREHRKRKAEREKQALVVDMMAGNRPPWWKFFARRRWNKGRYVLQIDKEKFYSNSRPHGGKGNR